MIEEFIQSIVISGGIPLAIFFSFRLYKGSFDNVNFSSDYDIDRIEINKKSVVGLIFSVLGISSIFLK